MTDTADFQALMECQNNLVRAEELLEENAQVLANSNVNYKNLLDVAETQERLLANLKMGIYEFLMAGEPKWDDKLNAYVLTVNETAMAQLADDMGVQNMHLTVETAWEAIKRHMGSIME